MMGTINCIYETPCHWCTKWDKECDMKICKNTQKSPSNKTNSTSGNIEINRGLRRFVAEEW